MAGVSDPTGTTLRLIENAERVGLQDYASQAHLVPAVRELESQAAACARLLEGRRVWMLNSTARGGGVAEMLPKLVRLFRDLGVATEWLVLETEQPRFFELTKRLHNLIHGVGDARLTAADRQLYEAVSRGAAEALRARIAPEDVLIVHDPQPLGAGALLSPGESSLLRVFRCHIGLDERPAETRAAWEFLKPYAARYDHAVFSAAEYIPDYLAGRSSTIHPGIDPASYKNRELPLNKLLGILCNSGLAPASQPLLTPDWSEPARRLRTDGALAKASEDDIGLGYRPLVLQVSRWDRLKGWAPLLDAFARLKSRLRTDPPGDARHRRRLELVRLVMAGPDPASIQDDPEARDVLEDLVGRYRALPPEVQKDVALIALPMASIKENALMVNVLQRSATVVVQNSLQEGFGLTVTEAMWKRSAVIGAPACGIRQQIRDGLEGRLASDAQDAEGLARLLDAVLADARARERWGIRAQRRVYEEFLVFAQVRRWLELLARLVRRGRRGA